MKTYGANGVVNNLVGRSYDPVRGDEARVKITGTHAMVAGYEAQFRADQVRYTVDYSSPVAVLVATLDYAADGRPVGGGNAAAESTWELDTLDNQISIWEHESIRSLLAGKTLRVQLDYRAVINALVNRTQVDDFSWSNVQTVYDELTSDSDLQELLKHLVRGDDTVESLKYVIRNTQRWPLKYRFTPDYANVNKQISSASLKAAEPGIPFDLPPGRYWLTRGPRIMQMGDGRMEQTREWWEQDQDAWKYAQL